MNPNRVLPLFFLLLFVAGSASGQAAPINGTAEVTGTPVSDTVAVGASVVLRVAVDVNGVTGSTGTGSTPVVLGAYQISVTFDKTLLRFDSASGGTSSGFTGAPTATNAASANSSGKVTITGAQTSSTSPTGNVSVATLNFTALAQGSAGFNTSAVSLSSAYVPPSYGPAPIPSTAGNAVVTIAEFPGEISNPSPANNSSSVAQPVTLSWTASTNTTSYDVYFGTGTPRFLLNTTSTSVPVSTQPGTSYQWRVVSQNAVGETSSATFRFTTRGNAPCSVPAVPTLTAPANAASGTGFTLQWNAVTDATSYRVDESTSPTFATSASTTVAAPVRELTVVKSVTEVTAFYFRVSARNESGSCAETSQPSGTAVVTVLPPAVVAPEVRVIPAVISGAGANGAYFRTALQLHNPSSAPMTGILRFHPAGVAGSDTDPSLPYELSPGETEYFADLVTAVGAQGLGSLDVILDDGGAPRAVTRVLNDGGENGTTGMFEPMLSAADALQPGQSATLIAPPDLNASRYNVGIRTLAPTELTIELRNSSGVLQKTITRTYPATYYEQNPAATLLGTALGPNDTILFRLVSGKAFVYGAATDNRTQDPSIELARP